MDSSVSPKDEIWFLRVCHHISNAVYLPSHGICLFLNCTCHTVERRIIVHQLAVSSVKQFDTNWMSCEGGGGARNMLHASRTSLHAILLTLNRQRNSSEPCAWGCCRLVWTAAQRILLQTGFAAWCTSESPVWWRWWYFYNPCNNFTCERLRTGCRCKCPVVVECNTIDGRTVL